MMTNKELFNTVISRLETESFLSGFKFRKRDSTFIWQNHGLRRFIELDHWNKNGLFIIYPIYMVRFDILLKWFEPYSFKSLQDQRNNPSVGFSGKMLERQDNFTITEADFDRHYFKLRDTLAECSEMVFSSYNSLQDMFYHEIIPLLKGKKTLPDVGADWAFRYLTLTRIVSPQDYPVVKELVLSRMYQMAERHEPNIIEYIPRLDEIIQTMESCFPHVR